MEFHTTESVVTVDWENGFVEASAKDNINVSQIFKELLVQAKGRSTFYKFLFVLLYAMNE